VVGCTPDTNGAAEIFSPDVDACTALVDASTAGACTALVLLRDGLEASAASFPFLPRGGITPRKNKKEEKKERSK
jgi:hypothetical protein